MNTNLLDLNNDILNIIGGYVKKDNFEREIMKEEQILNGKKIKYPSLKRYLYLILFDENGNCIKYNITKDEMKIDLFRLLDMSTLNILK
jgi:hypothetical protein